MRLKGKDHKRLAFFGCYMATTENKPFIWVLSLWGYRRVPVGEPAENKGKCP
jgi:hypothetical protein